MGKMRRKGDIRRWVIMTLRNNGASEAQFPLPVTHNGLRVLFERDIPTIVPAFYYDQLGHASLPRFETAPKTLASMKNGVKQTDDVVLVPVGYAADVEEIPDEFQTLEGIERFEQLMSHIDSAVDGYEEYVGIEIGMKDTSPHSAEWSQVMQAKLDAKAPVQAGEPVAAGVASDDMPW